MQQNTQNLWEDSYKNGENILFYPHNELVRFLNRFIKKQISLDSFENIYNETQKPTLNCDIDINESLQNINKDIQLRQSNTIKKNNFLNFK